MCNTDQGCENEMNPKHFKIRRKSNASNCPDDYVDDDDKPVNSNDNNVHREEDQRDDQEEQQRDEQPMHDDNNPEHDIDSKSTLTTCITQKQRQNQLPQNKTQTMFDKPYIQNQHKYNQDDPLIVLGMDISNFTPQIQFFICAFGVFSFTIIYGYLQELISVHILGRNYAMFLSLIQLGGYSFWSHILTFVGRKKRETIRMNQIQNGRDKKKHDDEDDDDDVGDLEKGDTTCKIVGIENEKVEINEKDEFENQHSDEEIGLLKKEIKEFKDVQNNESLNDNHQSNHQQQQHSPPIQVYMALSFVRALDIGLTNGAMKFINYPAKTLIKSSRVAFTMIAGLLIGRKKYKMMDYVMVTMLVFGLSIFLHADHKSKAIFHPAGILMLVSFV